MKKKIIISVASLIIIGVFTTSCYISYYIGSLRILWCIDYMNITTPFKQNLMFLSKLGEIEQGHTNITAIRTTLYKELFDLLDVYETSSIENEIKKYDKKELALDMYLHFSDKKDKVFAKKVEEFIKTNLSDKEIEKYKVLKNKK